MTNETVRATARVRTFFVLVLRQVCVESRRLDDTKDEMTEVEIRIVIFEKIVRVVLSVVITLRLNLETKIDY